MKDKLIIDKKLPQYKGNMHMHTTLSDGLLLPSETARKYKQAGYDFIVISDHEIYWNSDELDESDFLVIGGTESAIRINNQESWQLDYCQKGESQIKKRHHYMHYGCIKDETLPDDFDFFHHGFMIPRMEDQGIDSWNKHVEELREHGNLVVINHPNWSRLEPEMMLATQGCFAFEIWNTGNVFKCGGRSDDDLWDYCLTRGKRILAVAGDDSHACTTDFGRGFVMVQSKEFSKSSICKALKQGDFYASCGPIIENMIIEDGILHMDFSPIRHLQLCSYDCDGVDFAYNDNHEFTSIEWKINPILRFFRPVLFDSSGFKAWGQPVFLSELR